MGRLEAKTRAAEQAVIIAQQHQVRSRRPPLPLVFAQCNKSLRRVHRQMPWPAHVTCDFPITRIPLEDRDCIVLSRTPDQKAACLEAGWRLHERYHSPVTQSETTS